MPPAVKELILYVPNDIIVSTPNNTGMLVYYPAAKTSGGRNPVKITYSQASGTLFPVGLTIITVTARSKDGQVKSGSFSIYVQLTVSPLSLTVPDNITVYSEEYAVVDYPPATVTGGIPPCNITYDPVSGSIFPFGDTTVKVTATSSDGQTVTGGFIVRVEQQIPTPPPTGVHPFIWLTDSLISDINAKRLASDPDWLETKADADNFSVLNPPRIRVIGASNSNPVVFTTQDPLPWPSGSPLMAIVGATGNWLPVNKGGLADVDAWVATRIDNTHFSIPVNSTTFGTFAGQSLTTAIFGSEDSGYFQYGQSADGWLSAMFEMGLVYRAIGGSQYVNAAFRLLDWINELGAAGMIYPTANDGGKGVIAITGLSLCYDWLFDQLSVARQNATIVTINLWADWQTSGGNVYWNLNTAPVSNYWMNNLIGIFAAAYSTQNENAHAAALLARAQTEWATYGDPFLFHVPDATPGYDSDQGAYYGGLAVAGFNYGANDLSRYIKYFYMVKTATGVDITNGKIYAKRFMNSLIYQLKPDLWKSPNWGQWTGAWYGLMTFSEALMLSFYLAGDTEGGWAQYFYQNGGWNATGFPSGATTFAKPTAQDRLLYYKSSRPAISYSSQPLAYLSDGGEGIITVRSDWTINAHYAYFKCTPSHFSASNPRCAAHVDISRGTDYLLVDPSYWKGTDIGISGSPELTKLTGGAYANTLYFKRADGTESDGFTGESYDGGQLGGFKGHYIAPKYKIDTNFVFCENEFSSIYYYSVKDVNYFFRSFIYIGDGTYVIWDRIRSSSAGHVKELRWYLSSLNSPVYDDTNRVISSVVNASKIYIKPLLPANPSISFAQVDGAPYRVKVEDPIPAPVLNALTVHYVTSSAGSLPTTTLLSTIDSNFQGVQVEDTTPKVVVVPVGSTDDGSGNYTSNTYSSCAFVTTHAGTGKYLVCGLSNGTYTVRRNGVTVATVSVGSDGTAYFTSSSGTITIN